MTQRSVVAVTFSFTVLSIDRAWLPPNARSYVCSGRKSRGRTDEPAATDLRSRELWVEGKRDPKQSENFALPLESRRLESESFSFSQKDRQMKCDVVSYKNLYFTRLMIAIIRYSQRIYHFVFQKPASVRMCVSVANRDHWDPESSTEGISSLL